MSKRLVVSIIVIIVFHLVGLLGMNSSHPGFFIRNTTLNLLISCVFLLINHQQWNKQQVIMLVFLFIGGFVVELIGTQTGYLFGNYHYGKTLGYKLFGVPLIIGINWMVQIYIAGNILEQFKLNPVIKGILASLLLVILDFFIEPAAIKFDYWQWQNNQIPATNYISWFIISFLFLSLFFKIGYRHYNPVSGVLYIVQLMMFMALYFTN